MVISLQGYTSTSMPRVKELKTSLDSSETKVN